MADSYCVALGVPQHLHQLERPRVAFDAPDELLFRRFNLLTEADVTACIKFNKMSVNRERFSCPEDVILNTEEGGCYDDCGVAELSVEALRGPSPDGCWILKDVPGAYKLQPVHMPLRCNYAHGEVEVLKDGQAQTKIKPVTVKLAIRRDLQPRIRVRIPLERIGHELPLGGE